MPDKSLPTDGQDQPGGSARTLTPAAQRALAEAEARRRTAAETPAPAETGGPAGPDPVRYGDWERKGLATDF